MVLCNHALEGAGNPCIQFVHGICSVQLPAHLHHTVKKRICTIPSAPPQQLIKQICNCPDLCIIPVLISTLENLPMVTF